MKEELSNEEYRSIIEELESKLKSAQDSADFWSNRYTKLEVKFKTLMSLVKGISLLADDGG